MLHVCFHVFIVYNFCGHFFIVNPLSQQQQCSLCSVQFGQQCVYTLFYKEGRNGAGVVRVPGVYNLSR